MKKHNWDKVQESQGFAKVTPGGYICKITSVEDEEQKEYLRIEYDIAEGELEGYYKDLYKNKGFWGGSFIRSYKETALGMFKNFFRTVEKCNQGFKWNDDETALKGKLIGLVLAEKEYTKRDGSTGIRLYVSALKTIEEIKKGDFKVPELKRQNGSTSTNVEDKNFYPTDEPVEDDDLPF